MVQSEVCPSQNLYDYPCNEPGLPRKEAGSKPPELPRGIILPKASLQDNILSTASICIPWIESRLGDILPTRPFRPCSRSAFYIIDTVSYPWGKRLGPTVDHPPTSRAEVKGRVEP
jgi:hypothetical protein